MKKNKHKNNILRTFIQNQDPFHAKSRHLFSVLQTNVCFFIPILRHSAKTPAVLTVFYIRQSQYPYSAETVLQNIFHHDTRQHEQVAVGEVDELQDAVHHGVAECHERVHAADLQTVEDLTDEHDDLIAHHSSFHKLMMPDF